MHFDWNRKHAIQYCKQTRFNCLYQKRMNTMLRISDANFALVSLIVLKTARNTIRQSPLQTMHIQLLISKMWVVQIWMSWRWGLMQNKLKTIRWCQTKKEGSLRQIASVSVYVQCHWSNIKFRIERQILMFRDVKGS